MNTLQRELEAVSSSPHEFGVFVQSIHYDEEVEQTISTTVTKITATILQIQAKRNGLRSDLALLEHK
jgi:hypothetical protein